MEKGNSEEIKGGLKNLIENYEEPAYIVDNQIRLLHYNQAFEDWIQPLHAIDRTVYGKGLFNVLPFIQNEIEAEYQEVFNAGRILRTEESTLINGVAVHTETIKIPLSDGNCTPKYVLALIRDLGDQHYLQDAVTQRDEGLSALNSVVALLSGSIESDEPFQHALELIQDILDQEGVFLLVYDSDEKELELVSSVGIPETFRRSFPAEDFDSKEFTDRVLPEFPHVIIESTDGNAHVLPTELKNHGFSAYACGQLPVADTKIGYLVIAGKRGLPDEWETRLMESLCRAIGPILESNRLFHLVMQGRNDWENTVDTLGTGIVMIDMNHQIIRANRYIAGVLGRPVTEIVQIPCAELTCEGESVCSEEHVGAVIENQEIITEIKKIGDRYFLVTCFPVTNQEGMVSGVVFSYEDISERNEAEAAVRASRDFLEEVINQSPFGIWVADSEGLMVLQNEMSRLIFNTEDDQVIRRYNVFKDNVIRDQGLMPLVASVFEDGKTVDFEFSYRASDVFHVFMPYENEKVLRYRMFPVKTESDELKNVVTMVEDITETRKMQDAIRRKEYIEAIGAIATNISNDFNNIIATILLNAERTEREIRDDDLRRKVQVIIKMAERAKVINEHISLFSTSREVNIRPFDIQQTISDALQPFRDTVPPNIKIDCAAEAEIWSVIGDSAQILQILSSLMDNSVHALADSAGSIEIKVGNMDISGDYKPDSEVLAVNFDPAWIPGHYVRISVADNGVGIPRRDLKKIFEPFFSTMEKEGVHGLGLSLVYNFLQTNKGFIEVSSRESSGSTFSVFLRSTGKVPGEKPTTDFDKISARGEETILFIDDESAFLELMEENLSDFGYNVIPASSGKEALAYYRDRESNGIGLVVVDLHMPGMDGEQIVREILKINPKGKIIVSTGYDLGKLVRRVVEMGVIAVLKKPFALEYLLEQVRLGFDRE